MEATNDDNKNNPSQYPSYLNHKPLSEMTDSEKNLYYENLMAGVRETQRKAKEMLEQNAKVKDEVEQALQASR